MQTHFPTMSDDEDRQNRFLTPNGSDSTPTSMRERAASQPPRTSEQNFPSASPAQQHLMPSSLTNSQWSNQRLLNTSRGGISQPIPTRSSSFSANHQSQFASVMRDRSFSSTIEDDELEHLSDDTYDEQYIPPSLSPVIRGRTYNQDLSRSRSQSLATTTRPGTIGSPYLGTPAMASWNESLLSNPLNMSGIRYGEIKPPGNSRYGSLSTLGRTSANIHSSSPSGGSVAINGLSHRQPDVSNMSPFVRDVGQILLDDGSAFRELWSGMHHPRDENGGGGSGTTSRRHSVSVVQPRRGTIIGFNAPGSEGMDEPTRPAFSQFGRGGLMLSDEDIAADLGRLNLNEPSSSSQQSPSQPSSLPIYAPFSRSPATSDLYHPMNLSIPSGSYTSRQSLASPSDSGLSGGSPPRNSQFEQQLAEAQYRQNQQQQQQQQQSSQATQPELTARFIPGQGIQYLPQINTANLNNGNPGGSYSRNRVPSYSGGVSSPLSPTSARSPQQPQLYQRQASDAPLSELGKGVPLHAVPASWPLYIVEFKAGRTDLFYLTDLSQDIRVGDLVIVEADRGKDLGKVINDTITIAEVEAFQKQQMAKVGFGQPTSPGGASGSSTSSGKKEINPKMIYGKAQPQDTQGLVTKVQDEMKALQLCQTKVRAKKLPMEVVDAEYQWDRRKLTFYFVAEKRIDFRELVRELFRLYKTRIWMASLQGAGGYEQ